MPAPRKEPSMSTTYESPADVQAAPAARRTLVWDAPVRVFHWLMVFAFAGAYLTAESERFRLVHVTLGYTMAGLVAFRLAWGLVGTRHARFASFVRGPREIGRYIGSILRGRPEHHAGHNPAGAVAIVALLALTAFVALSGWATYEELGGHWLEETHEAIANAMLAIVGVHIAGVVLGSLVHRENLVAAMVTGRKAAARGEGIRRAWRPVAAMLLAGVLAFWWTQFQGAPAAQAAHATQGVAHDQKDD
jgi:cytochrome b